MEIGYKDIEAALDAARKLESQGYDVAAYHNPEHPSGFPYQVDYQPKFAEMVSRPGHAEECAEGINRLIRKGRIDVLRVKEVK